MPSLATVPFTTPLTSSTSAVITGLAGMTGLSLSSLFTFVANGTLGTQVDQYVQTSQDEGSTWYDIAEFHFTTTGKALYHNVEGGTAIQAGTLTASGLSSNTIINGFLGDRIRTVTTTTGTFGAGSQLQTNYATRGI